MANSYTGVINTNSVYEKVADVTGFTFTEGAKYTMQVLNSCYLKIGNAEFYINSEKFQYTVTADDLYIKTLYSVGCKLTILEG